MITIDKIKIYKKYNGDIDRWARSGSKFEKSLMEDDDWYLIDRLIQDLLLIRRDLASQEFQNNLESELKSSCEDKDVIEMLKTIKQINY